MKPQPPQYPHDALVRTVFGVPANMAAELRAVLPSELCAVVDLESLELEPGHFVDPDLHHAETDLLFAVRMGSDRTLVYVLVEHQSRPDPSMALRLLRYIGRVLDAHRARAPKDALPFVLPVVLYNGDAPWPYGRALSDLCGALIPEVARPYVVDFTYWLDDLASAPAIALAARPGSTVARFSWVLLQGARRGAGVLTHLLEIGLSLRDLYADDVVDTQRAALWGYIWAVALVDVEETRRCARQQGGPLLEEAVMTDILSAFEAKWYEGLAEGEAKQHSAGLLKLLRLKFKNVPAVLETRVREATWDEREAWFERALSAPTLDDVFER